MEVESGGCGIMAPVKLDADFLRLPLLEADSGHRERGSDRGYASNGGHLNGWYFCPPHALTPNLLAMAWMRGGPFTDRGPGERIYVNRRNHHTSITAILSGRRTAYHTPCRPPAQVLS